jgi:Xaa-Pro dipeptidase
MSIKTETEQRLGRLQGELQQQGVDGALIIYPIDVYYFSGTRQNAVLWVPAAGDPILLVRKSLSRAREESAIADIRPFPASREFPALLSDAVRKVGLTLDVLPAQQYNFYAKLLSGREFMDISAVNREVRSVKSEWELARLKESAQMLCGVFRQVPEFLEAGMRELDLAAEFEYRLRKAGNEGYVRMRAFNQELFQGLAVSGESSSSPGFFDGAVTGRGLSSAAPHGASQTIIERDVPVMLDYTGILNGYIVDMTRIFVLGRPRRELAEAFATALAIQEYLRENLKPGAICEELFLGAAEMAERAGLSRNFMGAPGENARFVGHGVGLELDELPILAQGFKASLLPGQTIAVEPKFVFPGLGVIGIENTYVVTAAGGVKITNLPDDVVCL